MKFENAAIVMTDTDTGKPYARQLSAWELNLVLSQLQALDGGALKAREIAPFVMRTPGVTEDEARQLIETEQAQSVLDRRVGKRVTVQITPAKRAPNHAQCCAEAGGDVSVCDCANPDWIYLPDNPEGC